MIERPQTIEAIEAELSAIEASLARRSNITFTQYTFRDFEVNWHHRVVASRLDDVLAGKCRRLIILEPPQNGKSEQVSRRFPAYAFGRNPNIRLIACSYNMSLAQDMSRDVQKIMQSDEYRTLFPKVRLATPKDDEKRTQGEFDIVGFRGRYVAAGVDGPISGKTANIGIIDDPIKNREEAESETYREKVWNWFKSTFYSRLFGNKGAIIICLTRWHLDDLVGRLLELAKSDANADQWEVVSLPAIAEENDEYRRAGEPLWPSRYPLDELARRRATMGEYDWASLMQQSPVPSGGALVKEEWFNGKYVDAAPAVARRVRGWDTAATDNGGDWTIGLRMAEAEGKYYIEDVIRKQLGPAGVDDLIWNTIQSDGPDVAAREEREGGSAGKSLIAIRKQLLLRPASIKKLGFTPDYDGVIVDKSKVARSKPFRIQCEAGNVYLVRGPWNRAFLAIICSFPFGKNDDDMDAASCAYNAVVLLPEAKGGALAGKASW